MNIYASHLDRTHEQTKELLSIIKQAEGYECVDNYCTSDNLRLWSSIFISSVITEQSEPSDKYEYVLFLGTEAYTSAPECTVQYEKVDLDDFIFQVKSVLFDLSMEN